jgi:hypothetical protein
MGVRKEKSGKDYWIFSACGAALFPATARPAQIFFRIFRIFSEKFSAGKISTGKILDFLTFAPKIFGPANFRPEFFWNFQISNRKKFPEIPIRGNPGTVGLRRNVSQLSN